MPSTPRSRHVSQGARSLVFLYKECSIQDHSFIFVTSSLLLIFTIVYTLDYFGYNGRRASTGSSLFQQHHRRRSNDESSTTSNSNNNKRSQHRRRSSQQRPPFQRYSQIIMPPSSPSSPLASSSTTTTAISHVSSSSSSSSSSSYDTAIMPPPLLSPSTPDVTSPLSPPLATPPPYPSSSNPVSPNKYNSDESFYSCMPRRTRSALAGRITALLVDDNHVNLQVLARILKIHMGDIIHQLHFAKNGVKALEMMHTNVYDIILLDIDMPLLNGMETARHIRASKEYNILVQNRNVPIVAVTTNDTPDWKRAYAQAGMVSALFVIVFMFPYHIPTDICRMDALVSPSFHPC